MLRNQETR